MPEYYDNSQANYTMNQMYHGDTMAAMMRGGMVGAEGMASGMGSMVEQLGGHIMPAVRTPTARVYADYQSGFVQEKQGLIGGAISTIGLGRNAPLGAMAGTYGRNQAADWAERVSGGTMAAGTTAIGLGAGMAMGAAGFAIGGPLGFVAGIGLSMAGTAASDAVNSAVGQRSYIKNYLESTSFRYMGAGGVDTDIYEGRGMSRSARRQTSEFIRGMDIKDTEMGTEDLTKVMEESTRLGLFSGTKDVKDFQKKFQDIVSAVKDVTKTLNTTLEDGLKTIKDLKGIGIDPSMAKSVVTMADMTGKVSGRTGQEMITLGLQGAEIFRGTGIDMGIGMQSMQMNLASIRATRDAGTLAQTTIAQAGGEEALALQMTGRGLSFSQSQMGRGFNASFFTGKDFDAGAFGKMLSGQAGGFFQQAQKAAVNMSDPANLIRFSANQEQFLEQMSAQAGPKAMQFAMMGNITSQAEELVKIIPGLNKEDAYRYLGKSMGLSDTELKTQFAEMRGAKDVFRTTTEAAKSSLVQQEVDAAYRNTPLYRVMDKVGDAAKQVVDGIAKPISRKVDEFTESVVSGYESAVLGVRRVDTRGVDSSLFAPMEAKEETVDVAIATEAEAKGINYTPVDGGPPVIPVVLPKIKRRKAQPLIKPPSKIVGRHGAYEGIRGGGKTTLFRYLGRTEEERAEEEEQFNNLSDRKNVKIFLKDLPEGEERDVALKTLEVIETKIAKLRIKDRARDSELQAVQDEKEDRAFKKATMLEAKADKENKEAMAAEREAIRVARREAEHKITVIEPGSFTPIVEVKDILQLVKESSDSAIRYTTMPKGAKEGVDYSTRKVSLDQTGGLGGGSLGRGVAGVLQSEAGKKLFKLSSKNLTEGNITLQEGGVFSSDLKIGGKELAEIGTQAKKYSMSTEEIKGLLEKDKFGIAEQAKMASQVGELVGGTTGKVDVNTIANLLFGKDLQDLSPTEYAKLSTAVEKSGSDELKKNLVGYRESATIVEKGAKSVHIADEATIMDELKGDTKKMSNLLSGAFKERFDEKDTTTISALLVAAKKPGGTSSPEYKRLIARNPDLANKVTSRLNISSHSAPIDIMRSVEISRITETAEAIGEKHAQIDEIKAFKGKENIFRSAEDAIKRAGKPIDEKTQEALSILEVSGVEALTTSQVRALAAGGVSTAIITEGKRFAELKEIGYSIDSTQRDLKSAEGPDKLKLEGKLKEDRIKVNNLMEGFKTSGYESYRSKEELTEKFVEGGRDRDRLVARLGTQANIEQASKTELLGPERGGVDAGKTSPQRTYEVLVSQAEATLSAMQGLAVRLGVK